MLLLGMMKVRMWMRRPRLRARFGRLKKVEMMKRKEMRAEA